jgi:hypothetical protein
MTDTTEAEQTESAFRLERALDALERWDALIEGRKEEIERKEDEIKRMEEEIDRIKREIRRVRGEIEQMGKDTNKDADPFRWSIGDALVENYTQKELRAVAKELEARGHNIGVSGLASLYQMSKAFPPESRLDVDRDVFRIAGSPNVLNDILKAYARTDQRIPLTEYARRCRAGRPMKPSGSP